MSKPETVTVELTVDEVDVLISAAERDSRIEAESAEIKLKDALYRHRRQRKRLCVKLEKRLAEVTNSDDRDAQVMQKNRAIRDLEQRLAVAVEALETVAKYDSHLNPNYLRIVGSNARVALSRIGAGKAKERG